MPVVFKKVGLMDDGSISQGEDLPQEQPRHQQKEREEEAPKLSDEPEEEYQNDEEEQHSCLYKLKHRVPHLYYVSTQLILPLLTLIGMSFLFGGLLAKVEMRGEIQRNDETAASVFYAYLLHVSDRQTLYHSMEAVSLHCWANTAGTTEALDASLIQEIETCASNAAMNKFPITEIISYLAQTDQTFTFDWMNCWEPNTIGDENETIAFLNEFGFNPKSGRDQQTARWLHRYGTSFNDLQEASGIPDENIFASRELMAELLEQATGSTGCKVHIAGGALFWFTVMTTIGYGNTSPTLPEGRLLVYTAGFLCIIAFIALNNCAARVWKHMFEHWFLKCNLNLLVHGPLSLLFWLSMTILWILLLATIVQVYTRDRFGEGQELPLQDAFWFSYVTITTVGFGDIHVKHEDFEAADMFYFPLLVLLGFNFLGIFADKAVELYNHHFPEQTGYRDILEEKRLGRAAPKHQELKGVMTLVEC